MTRQYSPYLTTVEPEGKVRGLRSYDPRQIYQYLFDNTDRYGIIIYTQTELAEAIQIKRETLNYLYRDLIELGFIEKVNRSKFRMLKAPQEIEWNSELYDRFAELRKRHQVYYQRKAREQITE